MENDDKSSHRHEASAAAAPAGSGGDQVTGDMLDLPPKDEPEPPAPPAPSRLRPYIGDVAIEVWLAERGETGREARA